MKWTANHEGQYRQDTTAALADQVARQASRTAAVATTQQSKQAHSSYSALLAGSDGCMKGTIGYSAAGHLFVQVGDEQVGAAVVGREVMPLDDVGVDVRRDLHLNLRWSIRPSTLQPSQVARMMQAQE